MYEVYLIHVVVNFKMFIKMYIRYTIFHLISDNDSRIRNQKKLGHKSVSEPTTSKSLFNKVGSLDFAYKPHPNQNYFGGNSTE